MANSNRTLGFLGGIIVLAILVIVFFSCFSISRIDSGQTGVMVARGDLHLVISNLQLSQTKDAKNTAVQNALRVENEKKAAIAEAEKIVAAAKGKADANRLLEQSITPELLQLKAIEKWDAVICRWWNVTLLESQIISQQNKKK